jgi:hypothetical protein
MSRTFTPLIAAAAGLTLAVTGLVVAPSPARAAAITSGTVQAARTVSEVGPATCNISDGSGSESGPFTSSGVAVTRTESGTTTLVDQGDAGDTTQVVQKSTAKVQAKEAKGQLVSVALTSKLEVAFQSAQGAATDCDATAQLSVQTGYAVNLGGSRWVTHRAEGLPSNAVYIAVYSRTSPASPAVSHVVTMQGTPRGRVAAEVLLPAGTYEVVNIVATTWAGPQVASDPASFSAAPWVATTYAPIGSARTAALGDATRFVATDKSVNCAKKSLGMKFTSAAGKVNGGVVEKAIFRVNGKKAKSIRNPKKGTKVILKRIAADRDTDLKVTLRFTNGGTASLTRSYWSCT